MGAADELRDVVAAGPFTWSALDKVETAFEEAVRLLGELASDPGFTGEAAQAASNYAASLRGDYLEALRGIDATRMSLERANVAWGHAVSKYATFDDPDQGLLDESSEVLAAVLTGGVSVVFDAIGDLFGGEDDDDRGEDGLAQLQRELGDVPSKPFEMQLSTGQVPYSGPPSGGDYSGTTPPSYPGYDPGDYASATPGSFDGKGSGLSIDGNAAGLASGSAAGMAGAGGGAHIGGAHLGGLGSGTALGGVGMLGAGVGAGAGAAAVRAGGLGGARGGMMGGGGMGGGAGAEESSQKRSSSGLKAPELEEDEDKAPKSEGAGAGGRASLPEQD